MGPVRRLRVHADVDEVILAVAGAVAEGDFPARPAFVHDGGASAADLHLDLDEVVRGDVRNLRGGVDGGALEFQLNVARRHAADLKVARPVNGHRQARVGDRDGLCRSAHGSRDGCARATRRRAGVAGAARAAGHGCESQTQGNELRAECGGHNYLSRANSAKRVPHVLIDKSVPISHLDLAPLGRTGFDDCTCGQNYTPEAQAPIEN